ncbi:hypothetical protein IF650_08495 [Cellulosimicrobium terreum]|nr:hypothetical protein [Cellulosimicrobium terreum]
MLGAALVAIVGLAGPATAHGGDVVISLGTDGQGGISANLSYKNDGHPVEESADVSVTATSDDGEEVGPLTLRSASEGVGWYVSEPEVLSEGHWVLTATMTEPSEAKATAEVDVVPLVVPEPDPADEGADDAAAEDGSETGDPDASAADGGDAEASAAGTDDGPGAMPWIAGGIVLVAAIAVGGVVARRRRAGPTPSGR